MFRFLHSADIHLDSPLLKLEYYEGAPIEALRGATRQAFQNLVDLAISESVDFVLISGDLYDGDWKDYNTGLYFVRQMSKLKEAKIPVCIVAGNHDAASKMTKTLRLPDNVLMFPTDKPHSFLMEHLGVAIHGQGFSSPAIKKDLSAAYPDAIPGMFNIGMLHTCATGREGHDTYAPCTIDALTSKGYDYWALGHVHQREILSENPMVVFPGNIQGRHIRESGSKGCMLVTVDDSINTEFRSLDVIRWETIRVHSDADSYELSNLISEQFKILSDQHDNMPLAVRIEVQGESYPADPESWQNEIRALAVASGGRIWVEKIIFHPVQTSDKPSIVSDKGPVGEILQIFQEYHANPAKLKAAAESLNDLFVKLPADLRQGPDAAFSTDSDWLKQMLREAEPLLLARLRSEAK